MFVLMNIFVVLCYYIVYVDYVVSTLCTDVFISINMYLSVKCGIKKNLLLVTISNEFSNESQYLATCSSWCLVCLKLMCSLFSKSANKLALFS